MRNWHSFLVLSLGFLGACQAEDDAEREVDEPGDYSCFLCADYDETSRSADDWSDEAGCSQNTVSVNPVADCAEGEALNLTFDDCRRKPVCEE